MNPMLKAVRAKRMSSGGDDHKPENVHQADHTKDLHEFVKQLSPDQKDKLHSMLSQDNSNTEQIVKGGPSKEEQGKIAQQAAQDNSEESLEHNDSGHGDSDGGSVDSDKIAMDMLDSRFKNNAPSHPRNLHERVQANMAKGLKAKGKI